MRLNSAGRLIVFVLGEGAVIANVYLNNPPSEVLTRKGNFMGLLGTEANLFADMTLIAQTAGFLILLLGWRYAKRKNFLKHDKTSKASVLLGGLSFIWMGFSLVSNLVPLISVTLTGFVIFFHTITGTIALFMGLFLVLNEIKKTKTSMIIAFSLWTAAMFLGVMLYYLLFV